MKKLFFTLQIAALAVFMGSCSKSDALQGMENSPAASINQTGSTGGGTGREADTPPVSECQPTVTTLIAGQYYNAGNVTVTNDANFIYVTYNTANGYVLTQTHLYVGACALIPVNRPGNPIPGQFPYASSHSGITSYTYQVPISAIPVGGCGCIAAHAVVSLATGGGTQTAWGSGTVINPDGQWGMKFDYCSCQ